MAKSRFLIFGAPMLLSLALAGCSTLAPVATPGTAPDAPTSSSASTPSAASDVSLTAKLVSLTNAGDPGPTKDYYWLNGPAKIDKASMPAAGKVAFQADSQGRSGTARASLTYEMFTSSKGSRQGSPLDPPNWPQSNPEVPVTYAFNGRTYHGYFWNRSHSVGDSLAGAQSYTSPYNFTSGTRQQNVGASSNGGMRAAEEQAENYWKAHTGSSAVIYYQTTPIYESNERFPRGSIVDVLSSDGVVNSEVIVLNDAEGYGLDYHTGSFHSLKDNVKVVEPSTAPAPAPVASGSAPSAPPAVNDSSCTKTSTGNCIRTGQTCGASDHGKIGTDAAALSLTCTLYPSGTWHWKK